MKERPILFSAPMVRAILDGRKTQTRRAVKPFAHQKQYVRKTWGKRIPTEREWNEMAGNTAQGLLTLHDYVTPYGNHGDQLWGKENFYIDHGSYADGQKLPKVKPDWAEEMLYYPADARGGGRWCCQLIPECCCGEVGKPRMRPSIFMPRWASRITLRVGGVWVERLQDISTADAIAEGIDADGGDDEHRNRSSVENYRVLWESINGKGSWDANPWVWVIEFKRVENSGAGAASQSAVAGVGGAVPLLLEGAESCK